MRPAPSSVSYRKIHTSSAVVARHRHPLNDRNKPPLLLPRPSRSPLSAAMKRKLSNNSYSSNSETSSSSPSGRTADTSATATSPANSSPQTVALADPKPARRGHFKSRLGCLNCKRRRVKCNELRPACSPCQRLGLACDYAITPAGVPQSHPAPLALEDLHFYHRFLNTAFPSLPLRADTVWKQCAAMSYQVGGNFLAT